MQHSTFNSKLCLFLVSAEVFGNQIITLPNHYYQSSKASYLVTIFCPDLLLEKFVGGPNFVYPGVIRSVIQIVTVLVSKSWDQCSVSVCVKPWLTSRQ